jgi:hypothetical protein
MTVHTVQLRTFQYSKHRAMTRFDASIKALHILIRLRKCTPTFSECFLDPLASIFVRPFFLCSTLRCALPYEDAPPQGSLELKPPDVSSIQLDLLCGLAVRKILQKTTPSLQQQSRIILSTDRSRLCTIRRHCPVQICSKPSNPVCTIHRLQHFEFNILTSTKTP